MSPTAASEPLDLQRLQTFYEVARLGGVHAAAQVLHRTQPAISHRLRLLQDELGVPLFERVGRRLILTDAGRRLQEHCGEIFAHARSLREVVTATGELEGRVGVGTLPTVAAHLLHEPIAQLIARHPRLQLSFTFDIVGPLLQALRAGRLDFVAMVGEVDASGLSSRPLGTTRLVAVAAPRVLPEGRAPLPLSRLRKLRRLAWDGPADPTFDRVQRFVTSNGLAGPFDPRIPNIETLRVLAASGAGYTILPEYTVRRDVAQGRLVARSPAGLTDTIPMVLLRRSSTVVSRVIGAVIEAFAQVGAKTRRGAG